MSTNTTQATPAPFAIELNGVKFTEFTKDLQEPLDGVFATALQSTMRELCENIPGCTFGMAGLGRIVLYVSGVEAAAKDCYAALATKLFRQEFRIAVEDWMIDEDIRMPMDTLRRNPHFCPSDEVLRLEETYLSLFDKGEFEACICTGSKPKWNIKGLGKIDTRFYLFCRMQNYAMDVYKANYDNGAIPGCPAGCARGACCYQRELTEIAKDGAYDLTLPELETPAAKPNVKPGMEWVIDLDPPDFRKDKQYILRWF